jgi:hypothetical protein
MNTPGQSPNVALGPHRSAWGRIPGIISKELANE